MIPEVIYQEAQDQILEVLKQMYKSIQKYREKEDHNPTWLQMQEERLAAIGNYVKTVQRTLEALEEERSQAYKRGFKRGKESVESPRYRQQFNPFDIHPEVVKGMMKKESIRNYIKAQAKIQWADHF